MVREDKSTWKTNYFTKIIQLLDEYPKCFLVSRVYNRFKKAIRNIALLLMCFIHLQVDADNVGSKQMQQIRISLRGHAVVLMGKNTMMRKAIRGHL